MVTCAREAPLIRLTLLAGWTFLTLFAQAPQGWHLGSGMGESYEASMDRQQKRTGSASVHLKSKLNGPPMKLGNLMQTIAAEQFRGKKVRLIGFARTANNPEGAFMWLRADAPSKSRLDTMSDRPIAESNEWRRAEIIMEIPTDAGALAFGFTLYGKGELWADDVSLELAPPDAKSTVRFPDLPVPAGTEQQRAGYLKKMESGPKSVVNGGFEQ